MFAPQHQRILVGFLIERSTRLQKKLKSKLRSQESLVKSKLSSSLRKYSISFSTTFVQFVRLFASVCTVLMEGNSLIGGVYHTANHPGNLQQWTGILQQCSNRRVAPAVSPHLKVVFYPSISVHFAEIDVSVCKAGQRVFDVLVNKVNVIRVDIFDKVGSFAAYDWSYVLKNLSNTLLVVKLVPVGSPAICGLENYAIVPADLKILPDQDRMGWNGDLCAPTTWDAWEGVTCHQSRNGSGLVISPLSLRFRVHEANFQINRCTTSTGSVLNMVLASQSFVDGRGIRL